MSQIERQGIARAASYGPESLDERELFGIAERLGRSAGARPRAVARDLGLAIARRIVYTAAFEAKAKDYTSSSSDVAHMFRPLFAGLRREEFHALFLGPKNNILEAKRLFVGTVDSSAVYPREIIKTALDLGATALIFVHNHPSGDPEPSACDRSITKALVAGCRLMQIKALDHIIIAGTGAQPYFSFADRGLIEDYDLIATTAGF